MEVAQKLLDKIDAHFVEGNDDVISYPLVFGTYVTYYVTLFLIYQYMSTRKAFELTTWVYWHNQLLALGSGLLLVLMAIELVKLHVIDGNPIWHIYCAPPDVVIKSRLYFYYWVNYVFKYVELVLTALMIRSHASPQFIHIMLNLTVHVIMYYYYARSTIDRKYNPWWKQHLTTMQIIQFVIGILVAVHAIKWRIDYNVCHGEFFEAYIAMGILSSYLFLFIKFFYDTYVAKSRGKAAKAIDSDAGAKTANKKEN